MKSEMMDSAKVNLNVVLLSGGEKMTEKLRRLGEELAIESVHVKKDCIRSGTLNPHVEYDINRTAITSFKVGWYNAIMQIQKPEHLREVPEVKALIEIALELQCILEDAENRNIFGEEIINRLDEILKVFEVEK
jgi:hypothetical protein